MLITVMGSARPVKNMLETVRKIIRTVVGLSLSLLLLRRTYSVRELRRVPTQEMTMAATPPTYRLSGLIMSACGVCYLLLLCVSVLYHLIVIPGDLEGKHKHKELFRKLNTKTVIFFDQGDICN